MNITTTALWLLAASESENGWPSRVVNVKAGAAAPTSGPAARAAVAHPASAATVRRVVWSNRLRISPPCSRFFLVAAAGSLFPVDEFSVFSNQFSVHRDPTDD